MDSEYLNLWKWLKIASDPQSDSIPWSDLPKPGEMPSPWVVWTLIGLIRHRSRQHWLKDIVLNRLGGRLIQFQTRDMLKGPETKPHSGVVPGLPEWEYYFHGAGCCLTHRVTGEEIDVDFYDQTADAFDVFFYIQYLKSLKTTPEPEKIILQLHPSLDSIRVSFNDLIQAGALELMYGNVPRLAERAVAQTQFVENFCEAWTHESRRPKLAAAIGDWITAESLSNPPSDSYIAKQAFTVRKRRLDDLLKINDRFMSVWALMAIDDLNPKNLDVILRKSLKSDICLATQAVQIIAKLPNSAEFITDILNLLLRLNPDDPIPVPSAWRNCIQFLLRHGYERKFLDKALSMTSGCEIGEAALLAMEYAPKLAPALFLKALRSDVPCNRSDAAAILALIDLPWSRDLLLSVLRESDNQIMTSECRAALDESRDPAARQAVVDWETHHPCKPEPSPYITSEENQLRMAGQWVQSGMEKFRDRVRSLPMQSPSER